MQIQVDCYPEQVSEGMGGGVAGIERCPGCRLKYRTIASVACAATLAMRLAECYHTLPV